jgi:hypothetical protein
MALGLLVGLGGTDAVLNLSTLDGMWLLNRIGVVKTLLTFGLMLLS